MYPITLQQTIIHFSHAVVRLIGGPAFNLGTAPDT